MRNRLSKKLNTLWGEDACYLRTATSWISAGLVPFARIGANMSRITTQVSALTLAIVLVLSILFPTIANADMEQEQMLPDAQTVALIIEQMKNETRPYGRLPQSADAPPRRTYTIPLTAYTSEVGQTDDTPCITASGLDVCERNEENVVAANFLPLGTRVRIPELYGNQVFYVEDRMNARYHYKMDIWMKQKQDAKQFGVKHATIEVF